MYIVAVCMFIDLYCRLFVLLAAPPRSDDFVRLRVRSGAASHLHSVCWLWAARPRHPQGSECIGQQRITSCSASLAMYMPAGLKSRGCTAQGSFELTVITVSWMRNRRMGFARVSAF